MTKIVDLSQEIYPDMPLYETPKYKTRPQVYLENRYKEKTTSAYGSTTTCSTLCIFPDHTGTHVDSPHHFDQRAQSIDKISLEDLCGNGIRFDFGDKKPGEYITANDLQNRCEEMKLQVKPRDIVLVHTGMSSKWGTRDYSEQNVGVHPDAVNWLLDKGVRVYGVDSMTPDMDLESTPAHMLLKQRPHCIIENLTNLTLLPPRFKFVGLPLKLRGASGSPIRAVGIIEE